MNISLRLCTEADLDVADDILVAAYQFKNSIKTAVRHYLWLQPDGWWLALADGTPVGFGGAVDYGPFSSVGMLSVYPAWQQRGIGEALTGQIVAWGEERGCPTLILESAHRAVSLYERHGFVEQGTTLEMVPGESLSLPRPSPEIEVLQAEDIPELVAFDAPYFGAERAKVFFSYMDENPGRAYIIRGETGQITGYLFARRTTIGPWIANTVYDAETLLIHALSFPFDSGPRISIPATNNDGLQLLKRYHFSQQSIDHYMIRGASVKTQRAMIYAQASPALG